MKKSANGNMYEIALDETWELFGAHLDGSRMGLVCVVSDRAPSERSCAALESAANSLGYGPAACTFVSLHAGGGEGEAALDDQALFLLIEGLDPLCLIAADQASALALGQAFRCEVALGKPGRVFGRSMAAFRNFDSMLDDGQDKQIAWALLKKLPRLGER